MGFVIAYFFYNSIFLLDLWDMLLRLYWRMKHLGPRQLIGDKLFSFPTSLPLGLPYMTDEEKKKRLKPFAIVVSVFNAEGYIRNFLDALKPHLDKLLVIDDASTDGTYRILEEYEVRYLRNEFNMKKPASIKRGIEALSQQIETVMVMDPDSRIVESGLKKGITDMEEVIADFQRSGADGCALRIKVKEGDSLLNKLQELEYSICLSLGRKSLLDKSVLSGIAIYKRRSLAEALNIHHLSVYAEDFLTSLLILNNGGNIYYDGRLLVETDGMENWKGIVSQRIGWDFGYIMGYLHGLKRLLNRKDKRPLLLREKRFIFIYNYAVYLGIFGILFHPVKLFTIFLLSLSLTNLISLLIGLPLPFKDSSHTPLWFLFFYIQYALLAALMISSAVEGKKRGRYLNIIPLYPFYALFLLMIRTIGFLNYLAMTIFKRKVYNDHYDAAKGLLG